MQAAVIIAAAGQGLRMGLAKEKQFLPLLGVPVLARSINIFTAVSAVKKIVAVVPPGREEEALKLLRGHCDLKKVQIAAGGQTRSASVKNGLKCLAAEIDYVLIHDAARPFASRALVERLLEASAKYGAAIPALTPKDTVKRLDSSGFVTETLPRDSLGLVQTPQVFKRAVLEKAYRESAALQQTATDDASLVEKSGQKVAVLAGEEANLKLTTPLDLALAELILKKGTALCPDAP